MQILRKKLTRDEFSRYLKTKEFGTIPPSEIVLHHTWKPTIDTWDGERTIDALKRYYEGLGWSAGPHIFVAEDGIWLFTDMDTVGIHAGTGNATWEKNGQEIKGYYVAGGKLKSYSIGVEVVGDYDHKVWEGEILKNACHVLTELNKKLGLFASDIRFHREFSPKSCPGNAITRQWLTKKLEAYTNNNLPKQGYEFQFSEAEARRAQELGLLQQINTETREIIAIGLVRLYDKLKSELEHS